MTLDASDIFEAQRSRLLSIGYRMLGSRSEAEDCVQDAWLRFATVDVRSLESPEAWLTTTMSRLCLDALRARKVRQDTYVGPWLPEPWIEEPAADVPGVGTELELADDLSMAFLLLLERLAPEERAAFLLHDVFEVGYPEIAATIDKREDAVRQIVARARKRVAEERPRFRASKLAQERLAEQFLKAVELRDSADLVALFRPDAVLISDGGGKVVAARRPIIGANRIAKFFLGITRDVAPGAMRFELGWMNDAVSVFVYDRSETVIMALGFDVQGDVIDGLYSVRNPDKLAGLQLASGATPGSRSAPQCR
jgi:RNA polymerase sigma-70 factor (ECF subfamily)